MQISEQEIARLKKVRYLIKKNFQRFGINKTREITRLVYEVSKREKKEPARVIPPHFWRGSYSSLKDFLLQRRYPASYAADLAKKVYLPAIALEKSWTVETNKKKFYPQRIFVEKAARASSLVQRLQTLFPRARYTEILSLKKYLNNNRGFSLEQYNERQKTIFVVREKYDFFQACPCTRNAVGCGYHIVNLGFGCIYECTYCYLQGYARNAGIILPANSKEFFAQFLYYKKRGMRLGSGEFTDSLALDNVTEFSKDIVAFFQNNQDVTFEFKTKSAEIKNLLSMNGCRNIVVSWSVNPQSVIEENEFFSASLEERLRAARSCSEAGYSIGFHFDPVIYFTGWEREYAQVIEKLFAQVSPAKIIWISIGTLRFAPELKTVLERRFPGNTILDEECVIDFDGKMRYPDTLRCEIYKRMLRRLRRYTPRTKIYLCMESRQMWRNLAAELSQGGNDGQIQHR